VTAPSLHNALPTIEALHASWSSRVDKAKYAPFKEGLTAAMEKLNEYYKKTAELDAHIFAMGAFFLYVFSCSQLKDIYLVLHPGKKMSHFKKYWASVDNDEIMLVLKQKVMSCQFSIGYL
jgi:hypothetical protein